MRLIKRDSTTHNPDINSGHVYREYDNMYVVISDFSGKEILNENNCVLSYKVSDECSLDLFQAAYALYEKQGNMPELIIFSLKKEGIDISELKDRIEIRRMDFDIATYWEAFFNPEEESSWKKMLDNMTDDEKQRHVDKFNPDNYRPISTNEHPTKITTTQDQKTPEQQADEYVDMFLCYVNRRSEAIAVAIKYVGGRINELEQTDSVNDHYVDRHIHLTSVSNILKERRKNA